MYLELDIKLSFKMKYFFLAFLVVSIMVFINTLQTVNITGFSLQILQKPPRGVPVNPCKHLQCTDKYQFVMWALHGWEISGF